MIVLLVVLLVALAVAVVVAVRRSPRIVVFEVPGGGYAVQGAKDTREAARAVNSLRSKRGEKPIPVPSEKETEKADASGFVRLPDDSPEGLGCADCNGHLLTRAEKARGEVYCEPCRKRREALGARGTRGEAAAPSWPDPFAPSYRERIPAESPEQLSRMLFFLWRLLDGRGKGVPASELWKATGIAGDASAGLMLGMRVRAEILGMPIDEVAFSIMAKGERYYVPGLKCAEFAAALERILNRLEGKAGPTRANPSTPDPRGAKVHRLPPPGSIDLPPEGAPVHGRARLILALRALAEAEEGLTSADVGRAVRHVGDLRGLSGLSIMIEAAEAAAGLRPGEGVFRVDGGNKRTRWTRGARFGDLLASLPEFRAPQAGAASG